MKPQSTQRNHRENKANYLCGLCEKLGELCGKKMKTTENTKSAERTQSKRKKLSDLVPLAVKKIKI